MHGRIGILGLLCASLFGGCADLSIPSPPDQNEKPAALADVFDPAATGTIRGRVAWDGDVPIAEETLVRAIAFNPFIWQNPPRFLTPHVPQVNPQNQGVANAVVYLRQVDPRRSKPWDQAKVRVEFHERQLRVVQGDRVSQIGFVRRGGAIDVANRDTEYHNLHGRGAAFFSMPLIESGQTHERRLKEAGIVDLTCAAGYYWMHAHLFVAEHPYYARTDADGRFVLDQVPAGEYEVVCWLPSWHVKRQERDPETAVIARFIWEDAKEQTRQVTVRGGEVNEITYSWTSGRFAQSLKR